MCASSAQTINNNLLKSCQFNKEQQLVVYIGNNRIFEPITSMQFKKKYEVYNLKCLNTQLLQIINNILASFLDWYIIVRQ